MYKSSAFTFLYKYVFTPVWGGVFIITIISNWSASDPNLYNFSRGAALMVGWALVWLAIMMFRLRRVEANEDHFIIKTFSGDITIDYKEIDWISEIALMHPAMISLKYTVRETGISKKILFMPGMGEQFFRFNFLRELEMTKFIRERIMASSPDYSKDMEPSRWLPVGLIFLSGIPVFILNNLYFSNF